MIHPQLAKSSILTGPSSWLHAQLVADFALTYKIELSSRLTAQPNVLSAALPGRSAYRGAGSVICHCGARVKHL